MQVSEFLTKNKTIIMPQPSYLPDLAAADFFLLPKLKTPIKGKCFTTFGKIKEKSKQELLAIRKSAFQRIGKNADLDVLYLRGVTLKGIR